MKTLSAPSAISAVNHPLPASDLPSAICHLPSSEQRTRHILDLVLKERLRQNALVESGVLPFNCADPMIDQGGDHALKLTVLGEEFGEVSKEAYELSIFEKELEDPEEKLRTELIQLAAVAVAWAESITENNNQ
jgi:hypothetical protein